MVYTHSESSSLSQEITVFKGLYQLYGLFFHYLEAKLKIPPSQHFPS